MSVPKLNLKSVIVVFLARERCSIADKAGRRTRVTNLDDHVMAWISLLPSLFVLSYHPTMRSSRKRRRESSASIPHPARSHAEDTGSHSGKRALETEVWDTFREEYVECQ